MDGDLPLERDLAAQLVRIVHSRLLDPLEILLQSRGSLTDVESEVAQRASAWAADLLGADEMLARQTGIRLMVTLYPEQAPSTRSAQWWQTPLGRVIARRVGHPDSSSVSYAVAGAMLGITRQGVHDLLTRGKLARHDGGGVTVSSVQDRLASNADKHLQPHEQTKDHHDRQH